MSAETGIFLVLLVIVLLIIREMRSRSHGNHTKLVNEINKHVVALAFDKMFYLDLREMVVNVDGDDINPSWSLEFAVGNTVIRYVYNENIEGCNVRLDDQLMLLYTRVPDNIVTVIDNLSITEKETLISGLKDKRKDLSCLKTNLK